MTIVKLSEAINALTYQSAFLLVDSLEKQKKINKMKRKEKKEIIAGKP